MPGPGTLLWALGLVLIVEGLIWAVAPGLIDDLLAALRALPIPTRRLVGLTALALGLVLVSAAGLLP